MLSILEQLRPIIEAPVAPEPVHQRQPTKTVRAVVISELRQRPLQTSREVADRLDVDRHSVSAELSRMVSESTVVREVDPRGRFRYRLSRGPDDQEQASPVLLADKILEKMSDGQEWDTPTLRIALEYPPAPTISAALRKMLAGGSIQLVRTVSRGSAHRHVYKRALGPAQKAAE